MAVNAGTLNHRVTLHFGAEPVPNGQGGFRPGTPDATQTVWAAVTQAKGNEAYRLGQQLQTVIHQVRVRHQPGLAQPERVTWRDKTLRVVQRLQSVEQIPEYVDFLAVDSGQ